MHPRHDLPGQTVKIDEEGECSFGHNVNADGTYRRTSLCATGDGEE
jgi:hypothetical protein